MKRIIQTSFDKESNGLYEWVVTEARKRPVPLSWLGREAFDCLRRVQAIAGSDWRGWLERAEYRMDADRPGGEE